MTSAPESFAITLGRASAKAMRLLSGMQRSDRDDVLATAILWCWENRESYNVTVSLETWIAGAVRNAYQQWMRGEARTAEDLVEEIPVPDDTLAAVENRSAAASLARSLSPDENRVAYLRAQGLSRAEIRDQTGLSKRAYDDAVKRISKLADLIPDAAELRMVLKRTAVPSSDDADYPPKGIDKAIGKLFGVDTRNHDYAFADDYVMRERTYLPWEDIRGSVVRIRAVGGSNPVTVKDYEGNEPNRRLLVSFNGRDSWWMTEEYLA
jgi:RNA polymerase sigma factor (sigma-70 family)